MSCRDSGRGPVPKEHYVVGADGDPEIVAFPDIPNGILRKLDPDVRVRPAGSIRPGTHYKDGFKHVFRLSQNIAGKGIFTRSPDDIQGVGAHAYVPGVLRDVVTAGKLHSPVQSGNGPR